MRRLVLLATFLLAALSLSAASFSKNSYPTGTSPFDTVSADLNRDGHPDLITSDENGFVTVLLGGPSGNFTIAGNFPTTAPATQLAVRDFNNDGYPDVMALEGSGYQLFLSAKNGALIPQPAVSFDCDCVGNNLLALDANRDHIPDLAYTLCPSSGTAGCALDTAVNDGTGHFHGFGQSTGLDGRVIPGALVVADFNRDGIDDLAVAVDNAIQIYRLNGSGGFDPAPLQTIHSPNGQTLFAPVAGDIDATNGADLVFAAAPSCFPDCIAQAPIYVYLNNGSGKLSLKQTLTSNSFSTNELMLVDLTGDNRLDLVALNGALQDNNGSLSWAHYAGGGTFSSFATITELGMPMHMTARDLNQDSRHDIALTDGGFSDNGVPSGTAVLKNTTTDAKICTTPPSSATLSAKLCYAASASGNDSFTFKAEGNSPVGVRRVELWIDGHKKYNSPDDRLRYSTTLSSGTHRIAIVAVDQFGATVETTKSVTAP